LTVGSGGGAGSWSRQSVGAEGNEEVADGSTEAEGVPSEEGEDALALAGSGRGAVPDVGRRVVRDGRRGRRRRGPQGARSGGTRGVGFRGKHVLLTYPNLPGLPSEADVHEAMRSHRHKLQALIGCFERHRSSLGDDGERVDGTWHMHIFGQMCLNERGDPPNIKPNSMGCFDIRLMGIMRHPNISAVRNQSDVWYVDLSDELYNM